MTSDQRLTLEVYMLMSYYGTNDSLADYLLEEGYEVEINNSAGKVIITLILIL